jgi:pimeloyl-ACP methyl ester carboxylesterase
VTPVESDVLPSWGRWPRCRGPQLLGSLDPSPGRGTPRSPSEERGSACCLESGWTSILDSRTMCPVLQDSFLHLRDGRRLQYLEAGTRSGSPVIFFHGHGSSRLSALTIDTAATRVGIRLISLDRPGIGQSDPKSRLRYADYPADVLEVADYLGITKFSVLGSSGGALFALACASQIPARLTSCGLVSPMGPFVGDGGSRGVRTGFWILRHASWLARGLGVLFSTRKATDESSIEESLRPRPSGSPAEGDDALMGSPEIRALVARNYAEARRQGRTSSVRDAGVFGRAWGFRIEEIRFTPVYLWMGANDRNLPPRGMHHLARTIPKCVEIVYPDEGHLSTLVNHASEIFGALTANGASEPPPA